MGLYLGRDKLKIILNGTGYNMTISSLIPGVKLLSSDNYILKDSSGLYLIPIKERE